MKQRTTTWIAVLLLVLLLLGALLCSGAGGCSATALRPHGAQQLDGQWERTAEGNYRCRLPEADCEDVQTLLIKTYMKSFSLSLEGEELYSY